MKKLSSIVVRNLLLSCLMASILLFSSGLVAAAKDSERGIVPAASKYTADLSARWELCERLLGSLRAVPSQEGEAHPVEKLFSMIGLMLHNSSGLPISTLNTYGGLDSIIRTRELIDNLKYERTNIVRRSQITELYQLFGRAAATGDDFHLAAMLYSMDSLTSSINRALFFAGFVGRAGDINFKLDDFHSFFMNRNDNSDPDKELDEIKTAWTRLASSHRLAFAEWLGRSFSEGVGTYTTTTIRFEDNEISSIEDSPQLPDLKISLPDYLAAHPGDKHEMTKRYYRQLASHLLSFYGIDYSDDQAAMALPAPQPGKFKRLVHFAKRLMRNPKQN